MSIGQPLRRWQRSLLTPIGWPTLLLPILGTAGLAYLSGWPHLKPIPWSVLIGEIHWPAAELRPLTALDKSYYASVLLWMTFLALVLLRNAMRMLVPRDARKANSTSVYPRRRYRILAIAVLVTAVCVAFGWQHRIARRWMARMHWTNYSPSANSSWNPWRQSPVLLTPEQVATILRTSLVDLPTAEERNTVLKLLVEEGGQSALPVLIEAIVREKNSALRVSELRLIALCRDITTADLFISMLNDADPAMRAAAADAVGILRKPSYSIEVPNDFFVIERLSLNTTPPIDVRDIVAPPTLPPDRMYWGGRHDAHDLLDDKPIEINPSVRSTLLTMMLNGQTQDEREAAARTLVAWPPANYQLRVAEWGVWISHNGRMALASSVIDEIPPFVHRIGNPLSSFDSYFLYPSIVTKPIVHLTSNMALAADVEVHIRQGRPWFAYPRPDDFEMGVQHDGEIKARSLGSEYDSVANKSSEFDDPTLPTLANCWEGYPWLTPHHRAYSADSTGFGGTALGSIFRLGLRWQSVIVSPEQISWMKPPEVPGDARFRWWSSLRQVPGSWVTNRGETERFLYYDGPTRAPIPAVVILNEADRTLHFVPADARDYHFAGRPESNPRRDFHPLPAEKRKDLPAYEGIYMQVRAGVLAAQYVSIPGFSVKPVLNDPLPLQGDEAIARLREMLVFYGLTDAEANGLITAWAPQWFKSEGRRFLMRISPSDYAELCPLQVRPAPTELVRLGLVLTEFDPKPTTQPAARSQ